MLENIKGNKYKLTVYGLVEFIKELEQCIKEGFSVDYSNEGTPQGYMGLFEVSLIKDTETKKTKVTSKGSD
jgi:hypothetical protein